MNVPSPTRPCAAVSNGPVFVLGPANRAGFRPALRIDLATLPRYTRAKTLKTGGVAYYWSIPTWAKRQGCALLPAALGLNRLEAFAQAESLNLAFDRWREGRERRPERAIPTRRPEPEQGITVREFAGLGQLRPARP